MITIKASSKLQLLFSPISPKDAVNKEYVDHKINNAHIYHYCGTIDSYNDLPSNNLEIGMVYNVENPDTEHGVKRGDNLAWDGTRWDNLGGYIDLSNFYTKDEIESIVSSLENGVGSIYYGEVELQNDQINIKCQEISIDKINTHIMLILKSSSSSISDSAITSNILINSNNSNFKIVDKFGNLLKESDVISGSNILLIFNGTNFVLMNKEYLLDSYQSDSVTNAPTAHALKEVYDHFESIIGDIPEILDSINRVVI